MSRANGWWRVYTAQVLEVNTPFGLTRHLKVQRHDAKENLISWDILQQIKNEMLGPDVQAIEIFPESYNVVNEANIRHLWEVPNDIEIPSLKRS